MLLKTVITILLLQNGVFSATLRQSRSIRREYYVPSVDYYPYVLAENEQDGGKLPESRRSWFSNFLSGSNEVEATAKSETTISTEPKVSVQEVIESLQDGYNKLTRLLNDKESMGFMSSLINKYYQALKDIIDSKEVQNWFNSLFNKIKKDVANHIVNTRIDSNPILSPVKQALSVISPIIGDPINAIVSKLVDYVS